ncbi:primosomal protein N' [Helicobacter felis]|uniref:Replication restart protein PriA n=1 Tax=Helicobacter felis (strain ATCC 49179 / CCUG 28539 / NCTC 12436 / CS1) TaxID=936155 RepID=E7AB04_HELFC|nr:primosomal protein N' [Helicobacter felis]CBY83616.1 putative primosomal replication factor [Helicobacter felis ATCC 49179]
MFYTIAPFAKIKPLTYESQENLEVGALVKIHLQRRSVQGVVLGVCDRPHFTCKQAKPIEAYFNAHQMFLLHFMAHYYCAPIGVIAPLFQPFKTEYVPAPSCITPKLEPLSSAQQIAYDKISSLQSALLFGDTGSGKTHIYAHLIASKLQQSLGVLVLVPEIALAPQIYQTLLKSFGSQVGLWHSKLNPAQRESLLKKLYTQEVRVVVGTRSALFLPMAHLGLLIVDEEHDQAYKANQTPFYNARDLSLYLAQKMPIQTLLGSATPSIRSYYVAQKSQSLVRLRGRFHGSSQEVIFDEGATALSPTILRALQDTLSAQQQSIIFLPTRAHFKKLLCQVCGQGVRCPFCSVNMSLHLKDRCMRCHYCQHQESIPKVCPSCQCDSLQGKRMGTQQCKKELEALLPQARIGILDKDHTHTNQQIQSILEAFNTHQLDILIGTQMISKGHDYPKVNLVVILGLDEVLHNGSYASFEQGVSLMCQIAGRSARKKHGRVLIQSHNRDFLQHYLEDYEVFLKDELHTRMQVFPPFRRLAQLEFSATSQEKAQEDMQTILNVLQTLFESVKEVEILGSGQAQVFRVAGKYRYEILLSAASAKNLLQILHHLKDHPLAFKIEIDPGI